MKPSRLWGATLIYAVVTTLGIHYVVGGSWAENIAIVVPTALFFALFLRTAVSTLK